MTPTRSLVESALLVALAVVFFLASNFLPVVGLGIALLCPAPLVVLGLRQNLRTAVLGMGVATLLVAALMGLPGALFFSLGFGVLGVGLGYLARKQNRAVDILLYGVLVSLGSKLLLILLATKLTGVNPFSLDAETMQRMTEKVFAFYAAHGMGGAALESVKEQMTATLKMMPLLFPSLLTMASALDCWLSYSVTAAVVRRLGKVELPPMPRFGQWRFPKSVFWALVASLGLTLLGARPEAPRVFLQAGVNLRLEVQMLFFLQGSAVVWRLLEARGWRLAGRVGVFILGMLVPLLSHGALLLGIVDMWWDLRSRFGRREA